MERPSQQLGPHPTPAVVGGGRPPPAAASRAPCWLAPLCGSTLLCGIGCCGVYSQNLFGGTTECPQLATTLAATCGLPLLLARVPQELGQHKHSPCAPTALWLYDTVCGVDCEAGKEACPTKCCRVAALALPCGLPPCDPARSSCLAGCLPVQ